jgi:signal transduction histidine kinase
MVAVYTYVIPILIGIAISVVVWIAYSVDIGDNEKQIEQERNFKKYQIREYTSRQIDQVNTIANSMYAFYTGSEIITDEEFSVFSEIILDDVPLIKNIYVIEDSGKIVQAYPNKNDIGIDFDSVFPTHPAVIGDEKTLMIQRSIIGKNLNVIIAVPFEFFIDEDILPYEDAKMRLISPIDNDIILYEYENIEDKIKRHDIEFTDEEKQEILTDSIETKLFGRVINQDYVLQYELWEEDFHPHISEITQNLFIGGIVMSFVIPFLVYRSESLRNKTKTQVIQLQMLNEELQQVEKAKNEFVAMISHELKTPLVPIRGYADLLRNAKLGSLTDKQQGAIDKIYNSSISMEKIIVDLFTAQKLSMDKISFSIKPFSTDDLLTSIHHNLLPITNEKNIKFSIKSNESMIVNGDMNRTIEVFTNLIQNAVDFVKQDTGIIEIGVNKVDDEAVFYVKDNGIGIPEDKQSNLFTKFYQVDTTLTRKHGGSGLGLAICKGLIEGMKGRMWFESKQNVRTIFYFTLPCQI